MERLGYQMAHLKSNYNNNNNTFESFSHFMYPVLITH